LAPVKNSRVEPKLDSLRSYASTDCMEGGLPDAFCRWVYQTLILRRGIGQPLRSSFYPWTWINLQDSVEYKAPWGYVGLALWEIGNIVGSIHLLYAS
jgi:hypothetical protein